ncbi:HXXEE domain-containing protein [Clostridium paraputrificum]|uniref:HXXEE domain-containing protein n=1 Tax=Clostridium TaxID=1485 RepID=UPI003D33C842
MEGMTKRYKRFLLLIPIIFIIHNIEEFIGIGKVDNELSDKFSHEPRQFLVAIIILSIIVLVVFLLNYRKNNIVLNYLVILISTAIGINGIFHILSSIVMKEITPGTITGIVLLILYILGGMNLKKQIKIDGRKMIFIGVIGIVLMLVGIVLSLSIGKIVVSLL